MERKELSFVMLQVKISLKAGKSTHNYKHKAHRYKMQCDSKAHTDGDIRPPSSVLFLFA